MFVTRLRTLVACLLVFLAVSVLSYLYMLSPQSPSATVELRQPSVAENRSSNCTGVPLWTRGRSKWFDKRYVDGMSPVWTSKERELDKDVEAWWLRIQHSKAPGNMSDILDQLFKLIPDVNPYKVGDPSRCLRCAVVGNSGNLRGSGYGNLIDRHDYVMRLNVAPSKGYEKDVGSRTTHRFMYPESFREVTGETNFVLLPFKPLDVEWVISALTTGKIERTYWPVQRHIKVPPSKIQVFNPALMYHIHKTWTEMHGRYPSTGMLALVFALYSCDVVNVFGYGATSAGNWDHYYAKPLPADQPEQKSAFRVTGVHDGEFQAMVLQTLEFTGKVRVYKGIR